MSEVNRGPSPGLAGAVVLLLALGGSFLWLTILAGPWWLASGMLDARGHFEAAERALSAPALKRARYETLAAAAAVRRARAGLDSRSPLFDVARAVPAARDALDEVPALVRAAEHSAAAARGTLSVADNALRGPERIIVADPEDPKGGSRVRIDRIEEVAEILARVRANLAGVVSELRSVDLGKLPRAARPPIRRGIERALEGDEVLSDAVAGFEVLPGILGQDGTRTYLIGMQNSAELRGPGGAMLQFALLQITEGSFELDPKGSSGTVYNIDIDRERISIALPPDAWYVAGIEDAQRFGNANWSPDWPLSARLTVRYAQASKDDFPRIDGVIGVDPLMLEEVMRGIKAFKIPRGNLISRRTAVPFLLHKAYASHPHRNSRRQVLKQVVDGFYERLLRPAYPNGVLQGMGNSLARKHMQIWMADRQEHAFIERMRWGGSIRRGVPGDYLAVVQQNVGGNKLNYFERQEHEVEVAFEGRDALMDVRVRVHNDVVLPQPRYSLGDSDSWHRPMLNVYVPRNARLLEAIAPPLRVATAPAGPRPARLDTPGPAAWTDGAPAEHHERGRKVWSGTLEVPPQRSAALGLRYRVPGALTSEGDRDVYRLILQHQPKVHPEAVVIRLNLPPGATAVQAAGWDRVDGALLWRDELEEDTVLEVSWRR
ncbi:MAG: DUF4012 domain-containing protein [Actinomycetota bacterium]